MRCLMLTPCRWAGYGMRMHRQRMPYRHDYGIRRMHAVGRRAQAAGRLHAMRAPPPPTQPAPTLPLAHLDKQPRQLCRLAQRAARALHIGLDVVQLRNVRHALGCILRVALHRLRQHADLVLHALDVALQSPRQHTPTTSR